jgi:hypothetical protein
MNFFCNPPEDLENSMPVEPMRLQVIGDQQSALKDLLSELIDTHPTKLKAEEKHKLRDTYRQILLNATYNSIRGVYTAIPRGKESFDSGSYWKSIGLTYRFTIAALNRLKNDGYILQHTGFYNAQAGFGRLTRIYGLEKLSERINAQAIGDFLQFQDDDDVETLVLKGFGYEKATLSKNHPDIARLKAINEFLKDYSWQQKGPMRLVYSDGPLKGGRVYSRFQNMPKAQRAEIKINGLPTVELDFKANHLMMLVSLSGTHPPDDPYLTIANIANLSRAMVKAFINTSLSAASATVAFNACKRSQINQRLFNALEEATLTAFPNIKLYSGLGVFLQSLEGQIALDIMVEGVNHNIPVLPVHDSFITTVGNEEWLLKQLLLHWQQHLGTTHKTKVEKKG